MFGSVGELIEALGGTGVVAGARQLTPSTVSSWRARGSIPAEHWRALVDLARERGVGDVTLEAFADLHARPSLDATA